MGALIQVDTLDMDAKALRTLLGFLVDTTEHRDTRVEKTIKSAFQSVGCRAMLLEGLREVTRSVDYQLRARAIQVACALLEMLSDEERRLLKDPATLTTPPVDPIIEQACLLIDRMEEMTWADWVQEVRDAAATELTKMNLKDRIFDGIILQMKSSDDTARVKALQAFAKNTMDTPEAREALVSCLNSGNVLVREEACQAASLLNGYDDRGILTALLARTSDVSSQVRVHALKGDPLVPVSHVSPHSHNSFFQSPRQHLREKPTNHRNPLLCRSL